MKKLVVAVSGGFDPVHEGHVDLFREAKELGAKLVVILNNDNWLMQKKDFVFMKEDARRKVLLALRYVDEVIITSHSVNDADVSVCQALKKLKPDIFANGGDRQLDNVPEVALCNSLGIKLAWGVGGGKKNSSSYLVKRLQKKN